MSNNEALLGIYKKKLEKYEELLKLRQNGYILMSKIFDVEELEKMTDTQKDLTQAIKELGNEIDVLESYLQ